MAQSSSNTVLSLARQKFLSGVVIAGIPIGLQIGTAGLIWSDPASFPKSDQAYCHLSFWFLQIILLCVAVCGNTLVNFSLRSRPNSVNITMVHGMQFWLFIMMLPVIASMLNSDVRAIWILIIAVGAAAALFLSYKIEIELALAGG
ncbi:hypothetical protein [Nitrospirillum viridazoti]|nr:hypothetical protein [Nitrospirillum amazonense]